MEFLGTGGFADSANTTTRATSALPAGLAVNDQIWMVVGGGANSWTHAVTSTGVTWTQRLVANTVAGHLSSLWQGLVTSTSASSTTVTVQAMSAGTAQSTRLVAAFEVVRGLISTGTGGVDAVDKSGSTVVNTSSTTTTSPTLSATSNLGSVLLTAVMHSRSSTNNTTFTIGGAAPDASFFTVGSPLSGDALLIARTGLAVGSTPGGLACVSDAASIPRSAYSVALSPVLVTGSGGGSGGGSATITPTVSVSGSGSGAGSGTVTPALAVSTAGTGGGSGAVTPRVAGTGSGSGSCSATVTPIVTGTGTGTGSGSAVVGSAPIAGTGSGSGGGSALVAPVVVGVGSGSGAGSATASPLIGGAGSGAGNGSATVTPLVTGSGSGSGSGSGTVGTGGTMRLVGARGRASSRSYRLVGARGRATSGRTFALIGARGRATLPAAAGGVFKLVHARGRASITLPDLAQDAAPFDVVVLPSGSWVQVAGPSVTVVAGRFVAPAQPDGVTIRFQAASGSTSFTVNVSAHTVWMMHAGALVPVFVSAGSTPVPTV